MDNEKLIKIENRSGGNVGYRIPEMGVRRQFTKMGEIKEIPFKELRALSYTPGGDVLLKQFLMVHDRDAITALLNEDMEPEYFYTEEQIKQVMISGSVDEFKDMVDFSLEGGRDIIKKLAVELPLNDIAKREYIKEKLSFDVNKAIFINNESSKPVEEEEKSKRRVSLPNAQTEEKPATTGRRIPKYDIVE